MATVTTKEPETADTIEQRFRALEAVWNADTAHLSSPAKIINHPAFQEIIHLGVAVVPFMLRDLEVRPRLWVWALPKIIGTDPLSEGDRVNIAKASNAWLLWAKENGYEW